MDDKEIIQTNINPNIKQNKTKQNKTKKNEPFKMYCNSMGVPT
jgi:hypothetical protein